jgi:hypothetical protein
MSAPSREDDEVAPGGELPPMKMASSPVHRAMASFLGDRGDAARRDQRSLDGLNAAPRFESAGVLAVSSV